MDEGEYDEFGNYIGGGLEEDDASSIDDTRSRQEEDAVSETHSRVEPDWDEVTQGGPAPPFEGDVVMDEQDGVGQQVILAEDKQYYPSAEQIYGAGVDVQVQEEDTQALDEPIIAPIKEKSFHLREKEAIPTVYEKEYLVQRMQTAPQRVRQIALVGHLHHGKTALMDLLVRQTHLIEEDLARWEKADFRYTDTHKVERDRGLSIKSVPMTLLLPDEHDASYVLHIMDTPGHVDFIDEVSAALDVCDGAVLVVDVVEGAMLNLERIIKKCVRDHIPMTLVLNKMDRLMLDLKLAPKDAYYKLRHTIEEVNNLIKKYAGNNYSRLTPERGNVCFASADHRYIFNLDSFATYYLSTVSHRNGPKRKPVCPKAFAKRLWGDIYFKTSTGTFHKQPEDEEGNDLERTFIHFILTPLYKIVAHVVGEENATLKRILKQLGVTLKPSAFGLDIKPLLRLILSTWFGPATSFVEMVKHHLPSPLDNAQNKLTRLYTGSTTSALFDVMAKGEADGPLMVHVTKLFPRQGEETFDALGRVYSGTLKEGSSVMVLGETYSEQDDEDAVVQTVTSLGVPSGRYRLDVSKVGPGHWCLIGGVAASIIKSATITSPTPQEDRAIFRPFRALAEPTMKIAIEPIQPTELPKMLDGLRKINKTYPGALTRVEESGEHIVLGAGELQLDCIMHDLRRIFAEIEIKISDPVARFCETIVEMSALKCAASAPNKKSTLTMIAEPLEKGITEDIEEQLVSLLDPPKKTSQFFQQKYNWDILAARNIWAFGPTMDGPNMLINDTLPSEVDRKLLFDVRDSLTQGFQWAAREGPLCDERTVFLLLNFEEYRGT